MERVQKKAMRPKKHALNGSMKLLVRRDSGKGGWSSTQKTVVTHQIPWIHKMCSICRFTHTRTYTELSINTHGFSHSQWHRTKLLWLLFSTTEAVEESTQLRFTSPLQ